MDIDYDTYKLLRETMVSSRAVLITALGDTAETLAQPERRRVLALRVKQLNRAIDALECAERDDEHRRIMA